MRVRWDAGEMGCGKLAFELHRRVSELSPGDELEIVAQDPGARTDLPAWCRMTGNVLISEAHPVYVIQRKPD